jgi:hypothetical protein
MGRSLIVLLAASAALAAALTLWTNHTTAATHATSHRFAQAAKSICDRTPRTPDGLRRAAVELGALHEPPNVHRAVARLQLHWRRLAASPRSKAERKQVRLSAHLLNVTACMTVIPTSS